MADLALQVNDIKVGIPYRGVPFINTLANGDKKWRSGEIVYVHPKKRFFTVLWETGYRECVMMRGR